jgi:hypothetical protein
MAKTYSNDLREGVFAAMEAGHIWEEVAELYDLALSMVGGLSSVSAKQALSARLNQRPQDICPCTNTELSRGS